MKRFISILIFTLFPFFSHAEKYELSICAIFQNEARFLKEWIDFHIGQGFEHFYLYNNNSTDDPEDVLKPYIEKNIVTYTYWEDVAVPYDFWDWIVRVQCGAYKHFVTTYGHETKWCAFIDTDEFLFCPDGSNLRKKLKGYRDFAGICVYWIHYGTNDIYHAECIHKQILFRSEESYPLNKHVKSICQVAKIRDILQPHWVYYKEPYYHVDENKEKIKEPTSHPASREIFRINHYWARDLDFFIHQKLPRRALWTTDAESCFQIEKAMNRIFDPILAPEILTN